ncbi:hypothetical protein HD554DRAFT_2135112, partial [Boletus coccyginus]
RMADRQGRHKLVCDLSLLQHPIRHHHRLGRKRVLGRLAVPSRIRRQSSNVRQVSLTPSSSLSASALRLSSTSSAYTTPPILALNSTSFLDSVPVLSENINWIWPSSSTRDEVP